MWRSNLVVALRVLWRNKLITIINVAGLSAAMAVAVLCLLFVRHETSFDTWHERGDRIHMVYAERLEPQPGAPFNRFTMLNERAREAIRTDIPGIRQSVLMQTGSVEIAASGERFGEGLLLADPNFFTTFTFDLQAGDGPSALSDPASIVLTDEVAKRLFGDADPSDIVGQHVALHTVQRDFSKRPPAEIPVELERVVSGVMAPLPGASVLYLRAIVPMSAAAELGTRSVPGLFVELEPGVTRADTEVHLARVANEHLTSSALKLQPLEGAHFAESIVAPAAIGRGNIDHTYLLSGLAMLILLVASINFVNLAMGRAVTRSLEIGVRKAVGAARHQLSGQFLSEAVIISLLAVAGGLVLAQAMLPTFNEVTRQQLVLQVLSVDVLGAALTLALVTGVLSGLYPALVTSRLHPVLALAGQARGSSRGRIARGLLVAQFALSTFLIIVTLVMEHQVNYMQTKDLGFDGDRVVLAVGSGMLTTADVELLQAQITSRPGLVLGVAGANPAPGFGGSEPMALSFGADSLMAKSFVVSPSYLEVMGTRVASGSGFGAGPLMTRNGMLLNETAARFFGDESPIGRTAVIGKDSEALTVIGVVEDFHFQDLRQKVGPAFVATQNPGWTQPPEFFHILFRLDGADLPAGIDAVKALWQSALPGWEIPTVRFLDETLASRYGTEQRHGVVMRWMSSIAIAISCMGLFGLAALAMARRTREVGIRKTLGATLTDILTLVNREFALLVIGANAIAWPVAYLVTSNWLEAYAYRIEIGMPHFVAAGAVVLIMAVATVSAQTWRAACVNPVDALRTE